MTSRCSSNTQHEKHQEVEEPMTPPDRHVDVSDMTLEPAPVLPPRARLDARKNSHVGKPRAPSPGRSLSTGTAEELEPTTVDSPEVPPPVPPRVPPRTFRSSRCEQRFPGRAVPDQQSPDLHLSSRPLSPLVSGVEFLRSRPPPPPSQGSVPRISFSSMPKPSVVLNPIEVDHVSLPMYGERDADLVWWPSDEQRISPSSHVHQLRQWPIPSLSAIRSTEIPCTRSRKMNEYIDTPVASSTKTRTALSGLQIPDDTLDSPTVQLDQHLWPPPPVPSVPLPKVKLGDLESAVTGSRCQRSIICAECGKCRCKQCTETKQLPQRWAGDCECSAQAAVDCCTCMFCVRALFYHCRSSEENDHSDDPCACTGQRDCCKRWTALGLLSLCLPCLCLYWPLEGAVRLCTACYNRRHRQGCCCEERPTEALKGLLLDSESSSSS